MTVRYQDTFFFWQERRTKGIGKDLALCASKSGLPTIWWGKDVPPSHRGEASTIPEHEVVR